MKSLIQTIIDRDLLTEEEAAEQVNEARSRVLEGEDAEQILFEEFGLEPDYVFDLI